MCLMYLAPDLDAYILIIVNLVIDSIPHYITNFFVFVISFGLNRQCFIGITLIIKVFLLCFYFVTDIKFSLLIWVILLYRLKI